MKFNQSLKTAKQKKQSGFTLIELLVVTTIMVVLMTIGLVSYRQASRNSRNAKRKTDLESVRQALVMYNNEQNTYPSGPFASMLTEIDDYLSVSAVEDPKNTGTYVYTYNSDGITFTLCAQLETEAGSEAYCLTNP